jgi:hypothetical protein
MCEFFKTYFTLDNFEKISNVIIAFLTLLLGFYVFVYQRIKDKKDRRSQWLKDLIIEPKLANIDEFYSNIGSLKLKINTNELTEVQKIEIISEIKFNSSNFRKNFLIYLQFLAPTLHINLQTNIDKLTDELTDVISNDELKLYNEKTYEREINNRISNSHSYILQQLFEYHG